MSTEQLGYMLQGVWGERVWGVAQAGTCILLPPEVEPVRSQAMEKGGRHLLVVCANHLNLEMAGNLPSRDLGLWHVNSSLSRRPNLCTWYLYGSTMLMSLHHCFC